MIHEFVLSFQKNITWQNMISFFTKEGLNFDYKKESIINSADNDVIIEYHINTKRNEGIISFAQSKMHITFDVGKLIVSGKEIEIREMVFTSISGSRRDILKVMQKVSEKFPCILESRSYEQRLADILDGVEYGRFHVKNFSERTVEDSLSELIWWHICGISQASGEFNLRSEDRLPVRRLRIEIRKLRAVLSMLSSVLNKDIKKWQDIFRDMTTKLSLIREVDVALSNWRTTSLNRRSYYKVQDCFSNYLVKIRSREVTKLRPVFSLLKFTSLLLDFMIWGMSSPIKENNNTVILEKIAHKKLERWFSYMIVRAQEHPDFAHDEKAHEIRVKAKSARYVMQSMSGKAFGDDTKIMRSLKKLIDALGILHDNYVNEFIARETIKKGNDPILIYQAGIFTGGEREQSLRVKKLLPDIWDKFEVDLEKWK